MCIQVCVLGVDNWGDCAGSPLCNVIDKETEVTGRSP